MTYLFPLNLFLTYFLPYEFFLLFFSSPTGTSTSGSICDGSPTTTTAAEGEEEGDINQILDFLTMDISNSVERDCSHCNLYSDTVTFNTVITFKTLTPTTLTVVEGYIKLTNVLSLRRTHVFSSLFSAKPISSQAQTDEASCAPGHVLSRQTTQVRRETRREEKKNCCVAILCRIFIRQLNNKLIYICESYTCYIHN